MSRSNICIRSCEPILRADLRHHHLSGAGACRSRAISPAIRSAKPIFCAARWARKIRKEMAVAARRFHLGCGRARHRRAPMPRRSSTPAPSLPNTASTSRTRRPMRLLTYQTAYMKANYPVEFLAASMTLDMGNTDKLAEFRAEAERLGIKVEPPSINRSGVAFEVAGNTIHYALAALRGVGRQAVETIVRRARRAPVRRPRRFRPPHQSARRQQAGAGKPGRRRRLRRPRAQSGARLRRGRCASWPPRNARRKTPRRGQSELFGGPASADADQCCRRSSLAAGRAAAARIRGGRLFPLAAIRSTITPPRSSGCGCSPGRNSRAR